ncbi:MAG: SRPBCC family protein [Phenylobacterium sp.]|uniref:SRPBCC family protein n=1 Tax=Phenylobacterium sp. TaxID=1871053 RepID=UPI001A56F9A8|nr:SRPBCC family protein [Phenylobacterium sp.]MBL8771815.1 SRPBCC family protein [Phenylobacterium sp.]
MDIAEQDLARITRADSGFRCEFTRDFDHTPQEVWRMLTDAARLPEWLAPGTIEPRIGGRARLDFVDSGIVIDSEVTLYEPDHLLEYSWSGPDEPTRRMTWTLSALLDGCRLTLVLRLPEGDDVARSCAGWEAHLDMLAAALEGVPVKFPFETFKAAREAYRTRLP